MFGRSILGRGLLSPLGLRRVFSTSKMKMGDPYKMLEATRNEDFASIKKKYYKLVNIYHPDKNGTEVGPDD
jgi:DnaJ-domain-containing protein 1